MGHKVVRITDLHGIYLLGSPYKSIIAIAVQQKGRK